MVAGDLVNTASRLQSVAAPGTVLVGEATQRAARARSPSSRPASRRSRARRAPVPAWRALRVVAERGGRGSRRPARGAVRRPRLGAAPAQGPVPRHAASARAPRLDHGPGGHRQEPPRLGVPEVRRRRRRARLVARGPLAGLRRGHHVLGARRDGPLPGGLLETRRSDDDPREDRRDGRDARPGRGGATLDRARPARPARVGEAPAGGRDELFAAWRTFFERIAATRRSWPWCSRTSSGPTRASSTSSTTCSSGAATSRSSSSPSPAPSSSSAARLGRRPAQLPGPRPRAARRATRCASCSPASCPGLPEAAVALDRRPRRGHPAVRGRDDPDARRRRPAAPSDDGALRAGRRARRAGRAGDAPRADRGPARRPRPGRPGAPPGRRGPRPVLHARPALAAVAGGDEATLERRLARLVRRELLRRRTSTRVARARPVRLRPGAHPRGRLQHARRCATAGRATSPRPATSSRSATTSSPVRSPSHYLAAYAGSPDGPEGEALAAQARLALAARPSGR